MGEICLEFQVPAWPDDVANRGGNEQTSLCPSLLPRTFPFQSLAQQSILNYITLESYQ